MIAALRSSFNARFTPERYARLQATLHERCGTTVDFRICETPCFFEKATLERFAAAAKEILAELNDSAAYRQEAQRAVPDAWRVPGGDPHPLFVQADFGFDENLAPKLVEMQGFPSLYAFQPTLAETYRDIYGLAPDLDPFLEPDSGAAYDAILREALLGNHDPQEVVLLEIQPETQKTYPDFLLTQRRFGIRPVCITQVKKVGNRLYGPEGTRIRRIYNRVIVDEMLRKKITPPFDYRDDLAVEWAGHPNDYFQYSKFSLPFLTHAAVPETRFLSSFDALPDDLEDWVLKPLFSFAGLGVTVAPTRAQVEAVEDRSHYLLQRRVRFVPTIAAPPGPTQVEVRVMLIWQEQPVAMTALLRMGRGTMMGVDHNRDRDWVGASAAFSRRSARVGP